MQGAAERLKALAKPKAQGGFQNRGNVNLYNRPNVQNEDGTSSSVLSASFNIDGKEVLLPTISDDGRKLSEEEAVALYKKTGKHLGKFDTPEEATAYAQQLHEQQEGLGRRRKVEPTAPSRQPFDPFGQNEPDTRTNEPSVLAGGMAPVAKELARQVPRGAAQGAGLLIDAVNTAASYMLGDRRILSPGPRLRSLGVDSDALFADAMTQVVDAMVPPESEELAAGVEGEFPMASAGMRGVGQTATALVPGMAAARLPKALRYLTMASAAGMQEFAGAHAQAKAEGADDDQAFAAALATGGVNGTLELVTLSRFLKMLDASTAGGVSKAVEVAVLGGGVEALQEVVANGAAQITYAPERELMRGVLASGGAGVLTAAILGGLSASVGAVRGAVAGKDRDTGTAETGASGDEAIAPGGQEVGQIGGDPSALPADFEPIPPSKYAQEQAPGVPGSQAPAASGVVSGGGGQLFASAPTAIAAPAPSQAPPQAPSTPTAPATPATPPQSIDVSDENLAGAIKRKLVERFERPRVHQGAIEKATGPVPEAADVRQAEVLYPGRTQARQEDFDRTFVEPILDKAREAGVPLEEIDRFLTLRHAEVRNEVAFQRDQAFDPETNPGIGVPTSQAQAELAAMLAGPHGQALAEIGDMVSNVVQFQRDTLEQGRLITPEERQGWERIFGPTYIPAKDIIEDQAPWARSRGFSMRGPESKRVKGRGLGNVSDSPLANLLADTSRAITRTEKATVDRAMAAQVRQYPQLGWALDETPPAGHVERADWHERTISYIDAGDPIYRLDANGQPVVQSIEHTITFEDPLMARAMRQTSPELGRKIVETVAPIARAYAALNTVWDPTFVARNATRDIELAFGRVAAGQGVKAAVEVTNPKRLAGLGKAIRAVQKDPSVAGPQADMVRRFREAGGQTAWIEPADPATKLANLERTFADFDPSVPRKAWLATRALGKWISEWNNVAENVVRVSAFQWGVENGLSDAQAAKLAKELTINFNAKGEWGPALNVLYLFYNAGVQGPRTIVRMAKSKRGKQILGGLFGLGAIEALVNSFLAGEDPEDGVNRYQKVQPWVRSRRMLFWVPGEDYAVAPPLAYGLNVPYEAGRNAMMAALGMLSPGEAAKHTFSSFVSAFSPFGDTGGGMSQLVSPWFTDPLVQSVTNQTFYGAPIRPGDTHDQDKPMSQRYWGSMEGSQLQKATTVLNNLTGGSNVKPGLVDVSPEDVENFANFLMGGTGRTVLRTTNLVEDAISGKLPPLKDIPLARDFAVTTDDRFDRNAFYETTRGLERDAKHVQELRATGREDAADRYERNNVERMRFAQRAKIDASNVSGLHKYTPPFRYDVDAAGDFTFKVKSKGGRYTIKTVEERDALVDKIQREFVRDYMRGQK